MPPCCLHTSFLVVCPALSTFPGIPANNGRLCCLFGDPKHSEQSYKRPLPYTHSIAHTAGCCFLFGGLKYREQQFNIVANKASCSLLMMACIGILIPTASHQFYGANLSQGDLLTISHGTCILLIVT